MLDVSVYRFWLKILRNNYVTDFVRNFDKKMLEYFSNNHVTELSDNFESKF